MSFRSPLPVVLGLALVAGLACEEFPEPLGTDAGQIPVSIQPVDWPTELAVGDNALLEVEVVDRSGAAILGVDLSWQLEPGSPASIQAGSGGDLTWQLTGDNLGWAYITTSLDQDPFVPTTLTDSVAILLAGVRIAVPADDTTLTAVGDQVVLAAEGLTEQGNAISAAGLEWTVVSGSSVAPLTTTQADQVTVEATAEGATVIAVGNAPCVSTGICSDTITVTVDQQADSVDVTPAADSLVSGDTVQLSAAVFDANDNNAPNETVTWTSRNTAVATVDGAGLVTAQSAGSTWVVASAGSAADSAEITVRASGELSVELTDAPADLLASAELFLDGVYVIDNLVNNGRRYLLDQPFSVDLLTLADTVTALAAGQVPATTYNDLILAVDSAKITLLNAYTFPDASRTHVYSVPGDTLPVGITGAATIASGDTVKIVLDFDVDGSFPLPEPTSDSIVGLASFTPTTRTVERTQAASIAGTVTTGSTPSVADVTLRAVRTDISGDTVYTRTDNAGAFKFRYLIPGTYDLTVPRAPSCHVATPASVAATVAAGEALTGASFSFDPVTIDSVVVTENDTIDAIGYFTVLSATAYEGTTALTGLDITWSSLNTGIATVNGDGKVSGVALGDAQIVASACGSSDTSLVTVRQVPASVTIAPENPTVEAGATEQFTATLVDSGGTAIDTATFQWAVYDTTVATIDSVGVATALKSGGTTIEAYHAASGLFATTELNVLLAAASGFDLGDNNGCAVTTTGQVACWGVVGYGILGIPSSGTQDDWNVPYGPQTIPLPSSETFVHVATGEGHACALSDLGEIYCWGQGGDGELGDGNNMNTETPVMVSNPGVTFTDVAAGDRATCAATQSGQAYCWGFNENGRLGDGTTTGRSTPTAVIQPTGVDLFDISMSRSTACAVGTNDLALCWGRGTEGQLGNGNTSDVFSPGGVNMPVGAVEVQVATRAACALGTDGLLYCWGENGHRMIDKDAQWGDIFSTPQQMSTETFVEFGLASNVLCALNDVGNVRCTGDNYRGGYGNGTNDAYVNDEQFNDGATGISVASLGGSYGAASMCALDINGDLYCWGHKDIGLLGTGDAAYALDPVQPALVGVVDASATSQGTCALTDTNEIYCWGSDVQYFTNWATGRSTTPTPAIAPPTGVVFTDIEKGSGHLCALTDTGEVYCLGRNGAEQLGDGSGADSYDAWVLAAHPSGVAWVDLATGWDHNCALDANSAVYCWGYNDYGQVGLGAGTGGGTVSTPTQVADVSATFNSVALGGNTSCATSGNSDVYCWGYGGSGQLGNGTYNNADTPGPVLSSDFFAYVTVAEEGEHVCALNFGSEAYCWGGSWAGQIGDGNVANYPNTPTAVNGGFTYDWIAAGGDKITCGLVSGGGGMKCWGGGWNGQYGAGHTDSYSEPVDAWPGITFETMAFPRWGDTACGVDATGAIYCAGTHGGGETGVGEAEFEWLPVAVGSGGN